MNWSFSSAKTFERCPRQWYFRQVVAHHAAKDPFRKEAYLLTKVDSVWSWRGRVVDDLITDHVVPGLAVGHLPTLSTLRASARERFNAQLEFASSRSLRDDGLRPNQQANFLALQETEEGRSPAIDQAWQDIENALTHLLEMTELLECLADAALLLPQRPLSYRRVLADGEPLTVRAVPDLIAFFRDAPPLIVDWKVHRSARTTFADQLAGYALALIAAAGQWGLPNLDRWKTSDVALLEVQLLINEQRPYTLTAQEFETLRAYQLESGYRMRALIAGRAKGDRNPYTVMPTSDLSVCKGCVFQTLCWNDGSEPRIDLNQGAQ